MLLAFRIYKKFSAKGIELSQFFYENDKIQFNKEKGQ
jgi:hypothetical protein